jgi:hypothetical protein
MNMATVFPVAMLLITVVEKAALPNRVLGRDDFLAAI